MLLEITKRASSKGISLSAKTTSEVETKEDSEIKKMMGVLDSIIKDDPQPTKIETSIKVDGKRYRHEKMASDEQLKFLRTLIHKNNLDLQDFCQENKVADLSELKMKDCRRIIGELNTKQVSKHNYY